MTSPSKSVPLPPASLEMKAELGCPFGARRDFPVLDPRNVFFLCLSGVHLSVLLRNATSHILVSECPLQILGALGEEPVCPVILDRCRTDRKCCGVLMPVLEEKVCRSLGVWRELAPCSDVAAYTRPDEVRDGSSAGRLQKACLNLMAQEFRGPLLDRLARSLGTSVRQMNRRFRDSGLDSPAREFRRLRMQGALDRMKTTTLSHEAIAGEMGYHDRTSFVRAFVRTFGISPASLRRRSEDPNPGGDRSGHAIWPDRT
ncbi:MAG TPA: helix-turn-helix domain-containing protein [Candidatus Polarisedimenticolia bacterium]|jgi:AraC-like DNA-binding protein|nr:helix-turn-helix domain-containing protein [Candidatus Polarisedimenticolia bacterium]